MVSGKNGYGIYSFNQVTFRRDTDEPHRDKANSLFRVFAVPLMGS